MLEVVFQEEFTENICTNLTVSEEYESILNRIFFQKQKSLKIFAFPSKNGTICVFSFSIIEIIIMMWNWNWNAGRVVSYTYDAKSS